MIQIWVYLGFNVDLVRNGSFIFCGTFQQDLVRLKNSIREHFSCKDSLGFILQQNTRGLLHRIAQWEHSFYVKLAQRKPDLVILLNVATDIAHMRRPEESIDELTRRIKIAQALTFQGARRVVLDSGESLPVVQSRALQAVFDALPPSQLSNTSTQTLQESERAHKKVDC